MSDVQITQDQVKEFIKNMTVLDLSSLIKELEDELGVSAAAPVAAMAMAPGGDAAPAEEEKDEFDLVLTSFGDKKIHVIKEIRAITGLPLKEAKELIDNLPKPVKTAVPKEEAEKLKEQIEKVGGKVEIK